MNQRLATIERLTKAKPPWWSRKEQDEYVEALKAGPDYDKLKPWLTELHTMYLSAQGEEKQALEIVMHACDENGVAMSMIMFDRGMKKFQGANGI